MEVREKYTQSNYLLSLMINLFYLPEIYPLR